MSILRRMKIGDWITLVAMTAPGLLFNLFLLYTNPPTNLLVWLHYILVFVLIVCLGIFGLSTVKIFKEC